jgi:uncharacterized membrane protein YfcA
MEGVSLPTILAVLAIGAVVGFLGGLFGKGGSAIATPLLAAIGIPPYVAVASPLPATIPATLVAARTYWRANHVDWRLVRWTIAVGFPATLLGAYATRWVGGNVLVLATEVILAALGLRFLVRPGLPDEIVRDPDWMRTRMVAVAAAVGITAGLLANSGGFLFAPLFVVVLHRGIKDAFGSSLTIGAALAVPGAFVHAALGHIDWTVVVVFGAASIPLSYVGARVALRTHSVKLERLYGAVLATLGVTLLVTTH